MVQPSTIDVAPADLFLNCQSVNGILSTTVSIVGWSRRQLVITAATDKACVATRQWRCWLFQEGGSQASKQRTLPIDASNTAGSKVPETSSCQEYFPGGERDPKPFGTTCQKALVRLSIVSGLGPRNGCADQCTR